MTKPPAKPDTRVARVQTFALVCRLPETLSWAQGRIANKRALLVRVETHGGAIGWGECAGPPAVAQAAIQYVYGPKLLGRDALHAPNLWNDLYRSSQPWARRGMMLAGLSGLDMALWDARGQILGQPLCDLLGGRMRERVPLYATGLFFRDRPETELIPLLVEEAHEYVEEGYRAIKAQIGRNLSFDAAIIRALRQALPHATLLADAARAYDLPEALHVGRILEEANFAWLEEPLSPEHPEAYRQLADRVRVPLAGGESEQTRWGFQSLLAPGGVALIEPNLSYCGGISEALHIRSVAASFGVNVNPLGGGTMINFAAALHFLAADFRLPGRQEPPLGLLGRNATPNPLRDAIFSRAVDIDGGLAQVPTEPGLGVTVAEDEMRMFCENEQEVTPV
jgi:D-galactarolactone cycloisomerase